MATITTGQDGSATITLSDGTAVRLPGLHSAPDVTSQDIRNVATALFGLVKSLDDRLSLLENQKVE